MKDPIEKLEAFYEACDNANPTRMLPDPALMPRVVLRKVLGLAFAALGPVLVGGALALVLLTVGSTMLDAPRGDGGSSRLERQLKQAGLEREDLLVGPKLPQGRTEAKSWRA